MRSDRWYRTRLRKYVDEHFWEYDDETRWYVDPKVNIWKFHIPSLGKTITLTCDDDGMIREERR